MEEEIEDFDWDHATVAPYVPADASLLPPAPSKRAAPAKTAPPGAKKARAPRAPGGKVTKNKEGEELLDFGSGKSSGRHFLEHYLGDRVFTRGKRPVPPEGPSRVCFEDSLQILQTFKLKPSFTRREELKELHAAGADPDDILFGMNEQDAKAWALEPIRTVVELIRMMARGANYGLGRGGYDVYVPCLDLAKRVPETKAETQQDRDQSVVDKMRADRAKTMEELATFSNKVILPSDGIPHTQRRPFLCPSKGFPEDYDEGLTDRMGTRMSILRAICFYLLDVTESSPACRALYTQGVKRGTLDMALRVPEGKCVILVGHCLAKEDLVQLCGYLQQDPAGTCDEWKDLTDDDLYEIPVVLHGGGHVPGEYCIQVATGLRCGMGETDFSVFGLWEKLCTRAGGVLTETKLEWTRRTGFHITSTDTDLLYYGIISLAKDDLLASPPLHLPPIHINYGAQSWVQRRRAPWLATEQWCDLRALYGYLQRLGSDYSRQGALNYVVALFNGGGDYMLGYAGLPAYWFALAIWHHGEYIGDLLEMRPHWKPAFEEQPADDVQDLEAMLLADDTLLPPPGPSEPRDVFAKPPHLRFHTKAYLRLVKTAYMLSKSQLFTALKSDRASNRAQLLVPPGPTADPARHRIHILSPSRWSVEAILDKTAHYNSELWTFPDEDTIAARGKQLVYYLHLATQLGQMELVLPDPDDFAYEPHFIDAPLRSSSASSAPSSQTSVDVAASAGTTRVSIWTKKKKL